MNKHRVVIAGAGFGGVRTALKLAKNKSCSVTVVADQDTFRYYPALYATATGHAHEESSIPLSEIFEGHENITFMHDHVLKVESKTKRLIGKSGSIYEYDSLVLALGMVTNYFGIEGLEEFSFGIKSELEVDELKNHLHVALAHEKHLDANYVIVGAGATGVELAAALRAYIEHISYCHEISEHNVTVDLIEAADRVMPRMSTRASKMIEARLKNLGITVMTNAKVEGETASTLTVNGQSISTRTVVWTSGVTNSPFFRANSAEFNLAPNSKVQVDEFLQGVPSVYVIGDNAATPFSGLAQTALYDADFVARNILRQTTGQKPRKYRPRQPPIVIPVGRHWAIFEWGPLTFGGWPGAIMRRAADLIGYSDILPLSKAIKIWRASSHLEEVCPVCREHIPISTSRKQAETSNGKDT